MTANVLLLNATYEPLRVISVRRAIGLLSRGAVEGLDGVAAQLRTPTTVFKVPSVVRLHYYVRVPRRRAKWSRRAILSRDLFTCVYCGAQAGDRRHGKVLTRTSFTIDHLIPRSRGGGNTWGNTACACR